MLRHKTFQRIHSRLANGLDRYLLYGPGADLGSGTDLGTRPGWRINQFMRNAYCVPPEPVTSSTLGVLGQRCELLRRQLDAIFERNLTLWEDLF